MHYQPFREVREQLLLHEAHVSLSHLRHLMNCEGCPERELTGSWDEDESLPAISKTKATQVFDLEGSYDF